MRIEICVPTKDRYSNLALLLWSLTEQSYREWDLTVIDDSEDRKDIREISFILPILRRMDRNGNKWRVEFGPRSGPHYCHQLSVDKSRHSEIFRVDDDCILSSNVLEELLKVLLLSDKRIGAVGPIVLDPMMPEGYEYLPIGYESFKKYQGRIDEYGVNFGDHQWRRHPDDKLQNVQHLYSSFLYSVEAAKSIGGYDLEYDKPGHREETDFTYRLWQNGFKLIVNPKALVWHLRSPSGGIRTFSDSNLWENCQRRFIKKFGFKTGKNEDLVIDISGGLGDHLCATPLFRSVKKSGAKVVVSSIYPHLFQGNNNIDELLFRNELDGYKNIKKAEVYKSGFDHNFVDYKLSRVISTSYGFYYDNDVLDYYIYPKEKERAASVVGDKKIVIISIGSARAITQYIDTNLSSPPEKARTRVKDWVKEGWEKLVVDLRKSGCLVWQVGITGEEKIDGCDSYLFDLDYRNVIAILDKCVTWISVDSFLNHAGHAIGKPGVVLFGPTDPKIFGHDSNLNIYHSNSCLHKSCLQGREAKFQWLTHKFECKNHECMRSITADEVLAKFSSLKIWMQKS